MRKCPYSERLNGNPIIEKVLFVTERKINFTEYLCAFFEMKKAIQSALEVDSLGLHYANDTQHRLPIDLDRTQTLKMFFEFGLQQHRTA